MLNSDWAHFGKQFVSTKIEDAYNLQPSNSTGRCLFKKKVQSLVQRDICMKMIMTVLFIMAVNGETT